MIPPKEAVGKGRQAYIDSIPDGLRSDICTCTPSDPNSVHSKIVKLPNSGIVGINVHTTCKKPANLWAYIETCENCECYYIVEHYPDKELLCGSCKAYNQDT